MTARAAARGVRPLGLSVVKGRARLPHMVLAPWILYVVLLAVGFLAVVYSQSALSAQGIELAQVRSQIAEAEALSDTLRLEIAALRSPHRIATEAEALGMQLPTIRIETLVAPGVHDPAETTWTSELVTASP